MNEETNTSADQPQTENTENPIEADVSDSELEGVTGAGGTHLYNTQCRC
jgi:hypothetical protein